MSDTSGSSGWLVLCGVLGLLLCVVTVAAVLLLMKGHAQMANWQRRWEADTQHFVDELRLATQKIADETKAKDRAQQQVADLQKQVLDLQRQIAAIQPGIPPVESP